MENESVGAVVSASLSGLYGQIISFLPALIATVLVLILHHLPFERIPDVYYYPPGNRTNNGVCK